MTRTWLLALPLPLLGLAGTAVGFDGWPSLLVGAVVVVTGTVSLLILRAHPRHPIGWLLAVHSFFVCVISPGHPDDQAWQLALGQVLLGGWVLFLVAPVVIAHLFPDGRALSRRWRWWIRVFVSAYVVFMVALAGDRSSFVEAFPGHEPPLPTMWPPLGDVLGLASLALVPASLVTAVVAVRLRLKRAQGQERLQLLWFTLAALCLPTMMVVLWTAHVVGLDGDGVAFPVLAVGLSAIPVVIGVAILRTGLFDIELVVSRALTYGALSIVVLLLYAGALALAGEVVGSRTAGGLLAVAVVAVAVHPVYSRLSTRVEQWVYGFRSRPHEALRMLADRAELADPMELTSSITDAVAEALKVDRAWVAPPEAPDTVSEESFRVVREPLRHGGVRLGDLAVEVPRGRQLSDADRALLSDLARHTAVLVHADVLTSELRQSRASLVSAREEERKRLRRDLHDGLGPSLAALVLKLNAIEGCSVDLERKELLSETRAEVRAAIGEVRRLVDDLRPPAIDEVGLLGAIRQRVAALSGEVTVEVAGPESLPQLPAAVEVAAFRIASEAVTNVVRHSGASRCRVVVELDGAFALTVSDNGRGAGPVNADGVGWTSMRQRAAELGGSCTISSRPEGGLVVRAVLPLAAAPDHAEVPR